MSEEPKKTLALDTDWITATLMAFLFLVLALYGGFAVWRFTQGRFYVFTHAPSWETYLLAVYGTCLWFMLKDRWTRTLLALILVGPIVRVALYWLGSPAALRAAAPGFAFLHLGIIALAIVLLVSWFRKRAKLV